MTTDMSKVASPPLPGQTPLFGSTSSYKPTPEDVERMKRADRLIQEGAELLKQKHPATAEWITRSACYTTTRPDWWFPPCESSPQQRGESKSIGFRALCLQEANEAINLCVTCPVRQQCLTQAVKEGEWWYGVRGGLIAVDRRKAGRLAGIEIPRSQYSMVE